MAERWAVATGVWSALSTWDGGASLPGAGDTVHANAFTVTIDQDITVISLNTIAGATAVAGGQFNTSGVRTINANSIAGTTKCLYITTACTQNGNSTGGSSANTFGTDLGGVSIQNGTATGGTYPGSSYGTRVLTGSVLNGNCTANGGSGAEILGGIINGDAQAAGGAGVIMKGGYFNGNSYGSNTTNSQYGIFAQLNFNVINGDTFAGTNPGARGIYFLAPGIFYGSATASAAADGLLCAAGCIAIVDTATGTTANNFGVEHTGGWGIAIIENEVGAYPKSLGADIQTNYDNIPWAVQAAAGGLLRHPGMSGGING